MLFLPALLLLLPTPAAMQSCGRQPSINHHGDIILAAVFNIHEPGADGTECGGRVNPEALQRLEAFLFAVKTLNDNAFVPDITFGAYAYDSCGESVTAVRGALDFLARREANQHTNSNTCKLWPLFLGMIGSMYSSPTEEIASLMTSSQMAQISYGCGLGALNNRDKYPYFLRTIPSGKWRAHVILDIISHLGWLDVVLVVDDDLFSVELRDELLRLAGAADVCIARVVKVTLRTSGGREVARTLSHIQERGITGAVLLALPEVSERFLRGLDLRSDKYDNLRNYHWIVGTYLPYSAQLMTGSRMSPGLISIEEYGGVVSGFKEYYVNRDPGSNDSSNPWLAKYWEQAYNCTNSNCNERIRLQVNQSYRQASYVPQVVTAVYTYANGLKQAHNDLCGNKRGLCDPLASISPERMAQYLNTASFSNLDGQINSFDKGNLATVKYLIRNVQMDGAAIKLKDVGVWSREGGLDLYTTIKLYDLTGTGLATFPDSTCDIMCTCENEMVDNTFGKDVEDADITIAGIFDLHGHGQDQYECKLSQFHTASLQNLEAMHFAIDQINANQEILPGLKIGSIALDSCRNPGRTVRQIKGLLNKQLLDGDMMKKDTVFHAVLGAASSDVSMATADFLSSYKIPQVSYGSSSTALRDRTNYPFFMRTIGADDGQAMAMVSIIKEFQWQYVTTLFSNNAKGTAVKEFLRLAEEHDICISTQVKLESYFRDDNTSMENIAKFYLLNEQSQSKVVVLFASDEDTKSLLKAVQKVLHSRNKTDHELLWLASDSWGSKLDIVKNVEDIAKGAITIGFYADEVKAFMNYFLKSRPGINERNPWISEYWQHQFQCYLTSEYRHTFNYTCDPRWSLSTQNIPMSGSVPYVIDGVYTIALGVHKFIKAYCGGVNGTICRKAQQNMHNLYGYIKDMRFYNGITNLTVAFDVLGDGIARYNVHSFKKIAAKHYEYQKVGIWSENTLTLNKKNIYAYAEKNGTFQKLASAVVSRCSNCQCSSYYTTNLEFQIKYAPLMLIGYFPIHQRGPRGMPCALFRTHDGFVQYMAFRYAIERINKDPNLLGNVELGYIGLDTCSEEDLAVEAFTAYDRGLRLFTQSPQVPVISYVQTFIGGYSNNITRALYGANENGNQLVQISPGSRSDQLSDPEKYSQLLRTSSTDRTDSLVVTRIVKSLGWTYVSVVYETQQTVNARRLINVLEEAGACTAKSIELKSSFQDEDYEDSLHSLLAMEGAIGVIVLASSQTLISFLNIAHSMSLTGKLIWIIPGGHALRELRKVADPAILAGSILVHPDTSDDPYFDNYMQRLSLDSDPDNPWLQDFWQHFFKCNLEHAGPFNRVCTGRESLQNGTFSDNPIVINTINAVYAYAYGMTELLVDKCDSVVVPPCDLVQQYGNRLPALVHHYIKKTKFIGADAKRFSFNEDGSGPGRFKILNFKMDFERNNATSLVQIGEWFGEQLSFNRSLVHMYNSAGVRVLPLSQCPGTCNCSRRQYELDKENVPVKFDAPNQVWGVLVITFTIMGVVFTFVAMLFFLFKYNHPVVQATTCSVSILLLFGIMFMYFLNFAFMVSPTMITCGIRRFGLGLFYCMVFACLLVKAITISRVYSSLSGKPAFISGSSQTIAALIIIAVHLIIVVEWLILSPPDVHYVLVNVNKAGHFPIYSVEWECNHSKEGLVAHLVLLYLLIVLTMVFSAKGRRAAAFHHEALYIFVAAAVSLGIHVVWIPVYLFADDMFSEPATCVAITVNASVVLGLIFMPKIVEITSPRPLHSTNHSTNHSTPNYQPSPTYARPNKHKSPYLAENEVHTQPSLEDGERPIRAISGQLNRAMTLEEILNTAL